MIILWAVPLLVEIQPHTISSTKIICDKEAINKFMSGVKTDITYHWHCNALKHHLDNQKSVMYKPSIMSVRAPPIATHKVTFQVRAQESHVTVPRFPCACATGVKTVRLSYCTQKSPDLSSPMQF